MNEHQLGKIYYGRRRPANDLCMDVKDALRWEGPDDSHLIGRAKKKNYDTVT